MTTTKPLNQIMIQFAPGQEKGTRNALIYQGPAESCIVGCIGVPIRRNNLENVEQDRNRNRIICPIFSVLATRFNIQRHHQICEKFDARKVRKNQLVKLYRPPVSVVPGLTESHVTQIWLVL
jgi:hypothetical protein